MKVTSIEIQPPTFAGGKWDLKIIVKRGAAEHVYMPCRKSYQRITRYILRHEFWGQKFWSDGSSLTTYKRS